MAVKWLDSPEEHDYDAAADYLSLIAETAAVTDTVAALQTAEVVYRKAKDILRAARPGGRRCAVADRRRLSPGVRELCHRREHPHTVPSGVLAGMTG